MQAISGENMAEVEQPIVFATGSWPPAYLSRRVRVSHTFRMTTTLSVVALSSLVSCCIGALYPGPSADPAWRLRQLVSHHSLVRGCLL